MKLRFQADNDLDQRIVDALMRLSPDCDFKTAPAAGFHKGTLDPKVLQAAVDDNRVLISHDIKTMPRHFGEFLEQHDSPGVVIIRQEVTIRDAALWLQYFYEIGEPEDFRNTIRVISSTF